ncbi:LacI family DNA-binding transcriptional regulator [Paractinoplanes durhamensis]|uniref:LacI family transcriptional regulator n=1 Tax=Paractinoplanes durhamensis TaxID=113563 RepID=A0ABQ3ZBK0_9ACTN|nr:LacI family DNA-binding transcriptional regulator [Actinoplanes durhamensis]GIE06914.1 LacI family transcriptional regulator [Actinoplanes durhamensis]
MAAKSTTGKRVTLRDVAARVGITPAACSMALADSDRISPATKAAVRQAAAELGYVGSSAARALRKQRAGAIALIVPTTSRHVFGHSYFMHVLSGVTSVANDHDTQVLIATNADTARGLTAYERVMRSNSADGAILTSAAIEDETVDRLLASGLPLVLIGNFPRLTDAITIGVDDRRASRAATEHLIEVHGRRRLLHLTGPLDHQTGVDRRDGFLDAVTAAGVGADAIVLEGDFSEECGHRLVDRLADGFDGIVAANDDMAFGALTALRERGRRVPGDVALIGFDDFGLSRVTTPAISTVSVPAEEMAATATERLLKLIDGKPAEWTRRDAEVSFRFRQSCGCG